MNIHIYISDFELEGGANLTSRFHGITGKFREKHGITENLEIWVFIAFLGHFCQKIVKIF